MSRGEMNADPVEGEFFTPEGQAEALVRESIQNSLDARRSGDQPVKVRFLIGDASRALSGESVQRYLDGFWPHLEAMPADSIPEENKAMPFLVIEDFGTRGLCGDPLTESESEGSGPKNDFFYFWRNIGRSSKRETERGRWGLGKTVFQAASRINSFFALTVREDDNRSMLMGQAVLKIHKVGDTRFCPYGFYATFDREFPVPIDTPNALQIFSRDFFLSRKSESGLSVVIPYPRAEELRPDELERAALIHYFYPILSGDLVVEIVRQDLGTSLTLDANSIRDAVSTVSWTGTGKSPEQLASVYDLAAWAIRCTPADFVEMREQGIDAPKWDDSLFPEGTLDDIRTRFEKGERLAFRVPLTVHAKSQSGRKIILSHFDVFLKWDEELSKGDDYYIRQGITIPEIRMLGDRKVIGLVVVHDRPLSTLLGDAEGPAHTSWQERGAKVRDRYMHGASCVRFVKNSLKMLVTMLSRRTGEMDENLLRDIFYLDVQDPEGSQAVEPGARKGKGKSVLPVLPPPPEGRTLLVERVKGGFSINHRKGSAIPTGEVTVQVAYQVRRGNPFGRYDPFDFSLDVPPIKIDASGAALTRAEANKLEFKVEHEGCSVVVTGFDPKRDLKIRVQVREGDR